MSQKDETAPLVVPVAPEQPKRAPLTNTIRYTALIFSCLLTFGGYLVFDLCSTLQDELEKALDINNTQYNLLYTVYSWTNCAMVLFAGALIDNTANRSCALLFCTLACIGQAILSVGVQIELFPLMVAGRTVFGLGLGSIAVTQNVISNTYFRDKDLATAFAATLTVSRVGSVLNFFLSTRIYGWFGNNLAIVFWWGTVMTFLSLASAIVFFFIDRRNERAGVIVSANKKSRKIKWADIAKFPAVYWILCCICSFYYINIFCLMAVMTDFLEKRNDFVPNTASMISSTIYFVAIPCVPFFGRLIDSFGHRMHWLAISVAIMIPFDIYLGWTEWTPIPIMIFAGMSYSMVASSLWPSICMAVPDECTGTANGIATSIQMLGVGASNLAVGAIKDHHDYNIVIAYLLACSSVGFILSIIANFIDKYNFKGMLNDYAPLRAKRVESVQAK